MIVPIGVLIARGRSADIYDHGPGLVVRHRRSGPIPEHEIVSMRLARAAGYPAPEVHAVDGSDMVLERVDGVDLLSDLVRRPWRAYRHGRLVGDLVVRLRDVDAGERELRRLGPPVSRTVLVHGDLHPGNVILTARGPMVIDWEGAGAGPADADAAIAWLLMTIAEPDDVPAVIRPLVGAIKHVVRSAFLRRSGRPSRATVDWACEVRLGDPNMRPAERERIRAFGRAHGSGGVRPERP